MSRSHFNVFVELASECEDREQEFCTAQICQTIASLEAAIKELEAQKRAIRGGVVPDFVTCDRLDRLSKRSKSLLNMVLGQEVQLPRF
jgi:hypothetical protein